MSKWRVYKYIRETLYKHGAVVPMDPERACFLGGSAMKVEPNYEAEPFTWKVYLQRATKYVERRVYTV